MKRSRKTVERKSSALPTIKFEQQRLTSFSGLVILQSLFVAVAHKARLRRWFRHARAGKVYGRSTIFLQLIVHLLSGFRDLRESAHYRDDPMVQRLLGLRRLPDVATISRMLKDTDESSVRHARQASSH